MTRFIGRKGTSYAPKTENQAARTIRRHNLNASKLAKSEKARGIPSIQSVLSFKPVDKAPTIQRPVDSEDIELSSSDTQDEKQIMSPVAAPAISDHAISIYESEEENHDFGIIQPCVNERQEEAANEELVFIVDDELEEEGAGAEGEEEGEEGDGENEEGENNDFMDLDLLEGISIRFIPRASEIPIMTDYSMRRHRCGGSCEISAHAV